MTDELGRAVLALARAAIAARLGLARPAPSSHPALDEAAACFVTLTLNGALRGCIGSLGPRRSLREDVRENAVGAAFRDPRFAPLGREEFERIGIEVSLLAPAQPMHCRDEADALAQLRPGVDGVILDCAGHCATFLPQVWESLPDPRRFLGELKRKAGLAVDHWAPDLRLSRYEVRKWKEAPATAKP